MRRLLAVVLMILPIVGCGSQYAPVAGVVRLDGKPLADATVVFEPISSDKYPGPSSQAKTDERGEFVLYTIVGNQNGAVIGKHRVKITAYEELPDGIHAKPLVPKEYNAESTLSFEVPAGGRERAVFDLQSVDKQSMRARKK